MSLYYYDANGYVGDAASLGGWGDFLPVLERAGGLLGAFATEGVSREPELLADALETFLGGPGTPGLSPANRKVADFLLKAARVASGILILNDGTDNSPDDEDEEIGVDYSSDEYYAQVGKDLDVLEAKSKVQFTEVLTEMRDAVERALRKKPKAAQFKLPYMDEFHDVLEESLRLAHVKGRQDGGNEASTQAMALGHALDYAEADDTSFTPKAALKWLKEKQLHIAGVFSDNLTNAIKNLLVNAFKSSTPVGEIVERMYDLFDPWLGSEKLKEGVPPEPHKLNTLVRTVTTEAYNHGRLTEYLDPRLKKYMQGVRYSAILDHRTTQVCRSLDGLVFKIDDPDLMSLIPPNHFNCRSILVPVVLGQEVKADEFITASQKKRARKLADVKFLEQEDV